MNLDEYFAKLPAEKPRGWMPYQSEEDRVIAALYCHGPCSAATVAAALGQDDAARVAKTIGGMLGTRVMMKSVRLPGQAEAVDLFYARGNGVG